MKKKIGIIALAVVILLGVLLFALKTPLRNFAVSHFGEALQGKVEYSLFYENNVMHSNINEVDFENNDVREVRVMKNKKRLINHSRGFALSFPPDTEFDFSNGAEYVKGTCADYSVVISKELSTYETPEQVPDFVKDYLHKYMLDETYLSENNITLHENTREWIENRDVQIVALSRTPYPGSTVRDNTYVYCYIYNDTTTFYRFMFKAPAYTPKLMEQVREMIASFSTAVEVVGTTGTFTDFKPETPDFWSEETRRFYEELKNSDRCKFGIFYLSAIPNNDFSKVRALEEKIGEDFEGYMDYWYYFEDIPSETLKSVCEQGKVVEITLQTSTVMNENLNGFNPTWEVLDGVHDDHFREMANQIKAIEHPVLFRLNNEMNSDWTSYCASACLDDPEVYVAVWRRIYDIFKENGVDNAIWVFNPNDLGFPPCGYNASTAFYPGNDYVQVLGITGYNTGTYYENVTKESWRSFEEIYDGITQREFDIYGEFPWVITEFASSSVGGDKPAWIRDMFRVLPKYPNIKMAFWFNSADYDPDYPKETVVSRPYWLEETPECIRAFSEGLREYKQALSQ